MILVNKEILTDNEKENHDYWNEFYKKFDIKEESSFCKFIKSRIPINTQIIELGCGTARDTLAFSKNGFSIIGVDRSNEVIKNNNMYLKEMEANKKISFVTLDISEKEELYKLLKNVNNEAKESNNKLLIYTRFFLHSINEENENILLETLNNVLLPGDTFASEFRTVEDENRSKVYGDHFRRYIDSDKLLIDLQTKYSFRVVEYSKGLGFSNFKGEDPFLARVIVEKI